MADESDILDAIARGDHHRAYVLVARAYYVRGYGLAHRLVRDATLADDVMQEAMLQVYQGLRTIKHPERLRAWVMAIVAHRALDELRRRARARQLFVYDGDDDGAAAAPSAEARMLAREDERLLEEVLDTLGRGVREVVILRAREELSFKQIGEILEIEPDAARARYDRALPRVAERLERRRRGPPLVARTLARGTGVERDVRAEDAEPARAEEDAEPARAEGAYEVAAVSDRPDAARDLV